MLYFDSILLSLSCVIKSLQLCETTICWNPTNNLVLENCVSKSALCHFPLSLSFIIIFHLKIISVFPLFFLSQKQKRSDFPSCDSFCTIACKIPISSSQYFLSKQRFDSKALSSKWFFFVFLPFFFGTQQGLWPFLSIAHVLSFLFLYYYVLWPRCLEISQLLGDTVWPILCQLILFLNC